MTAVTMTFSYETVLKFKNLWEAKVRAGDYKGIRVGQAFFWFIGGEKVTSEGNRQFLGRLYEKDGDEAFNIIGSRILWG